MIKNKRRGFILIAVTFVTALLLLMSAYILNFTLTELKISTSQSTATQAYYLAESGVAEAIWRIKNDSTWKNGFENNSNWTMTYTRNESLFANGSYTINIVNSGLARGEITVTGKIAKGASTAQRVIKTSVFKATGENPLGDVAEYADGNIDISASIMHVYNGSLYSNNNIILNLFSGVDVDNKVSAGVRIVKQSTSILNAATIIEGADELPMPAVSFDNASDPNSLKSRANNIYTASQFSNLLWNNTSLTLNGITYVTGDVEIKGGRDLTINGVLVTDGDVYLGKNTLFCCWKTSGCFNRSDVVINKTSTSSPSGIISKGKINFELCLGNFTANGLIYANDQINMLSFTNSMTVTGGIISRKLSLASIWQGMNIIFNNDNIIAGLGSSIFSPVVTVEHWEEEY
jgi:Tfp pilus assembly protein PilX